MADSTLIEDTYDKIRIIEQQKRRLSLMVSGYMLLGISGLGANAFAFIAYSHQKGGLSGNNIMMIGALVLFSIIILGIAINKFIILSKMGNKLRQIEALEETIYNEVLRQHPD